MTSFTNTALSFLFVVVLVSVTRELKGVQSKSLYDNGNLDSRGYSSVFNGRASQSQPELIKRAATTENNITMVMNQLFDSHQQLIVHWAGRGSGVIICLAKDPSTASIRSSSIFISYDNGSTFENKTHFFSLQDGTGNYSSVDKFFKHAKYNAHFVFIDSQNKVIYTTTNYGKNFKLVKLQFHPTDIYFNDEEPSTFLAHDDIDSMKKLWVTKDFGHTWSHVQDNVKSYFWSYFLNGKNILYVERKESSGNSTIISSTNLFQNGDLNIIAINVEDFAIQNDFIFVTKKSEEKHLDLYISYARQPFVKAVFQTQLRNFNYHITDTSEGIIFMVVDHGDDGLRHLYVSSEITMNEMFFKLSLPRIFCSFHKITMKAQPSENVTGEPFVDFHKVEGVRGTYIATQISQETVREVSPQNLTSFITFDMGGEWRPLEVRKVIRDGVPIKCDRFEGCSFLLAPRFNQQNLITPSITTILSSKSAPGIIIASGIIKNSGSGHIGVFISHDQGHSWFQALNGQHLFSFGDHGGVITAVKYLNSNDERSELLYSTDDGLNWKSYEFHHNNMHIYGLMTEPGENTTVFTVLGTDKEHHQWLTVTFDLKGAFSYKCTKDDLTHWSPDNLNGSKVPCLMGRKEVFLRRMPHKNCYHGRDFDRQTKIESCECDEEDFHCDDGFQYNPELHQCLSNDTNDFDPYGIPESCHPGQMYNRTKGYVKIEGNLCEGGNEFRYVPDVLPCPIEPKKEFLLVNQRSKIIRIDLENSKYETLPISNFQNAAAIEFDMRGKCVYWSDITTNVIARQCVFDDKHTPEKLVELNVEMVEGLALDWTSNLLYFVDGSRAKIEAIRIDVWIADRMRRTILDSSVLKKPRGIAVHPMQGYLFWTDWSVDEPSVSRANLDGTDVHILFSKYDVKWPNGITIDFISEKIYWVDAYYDYIASSDYDGKSFRKIISNDAHATHPFSVNVFKDDLYWNDWNLRRVYKANKDFGTRVTAISDMVSGMLSFKVYAHGVQEGSNACSNESNACPYICVGLPHGKFQCLCPDSLVERDNDCFCPGFEKPDANGTCPEKPPSSHEDHFKCDNGLYVNNSLLCDGKDDCGDRTDEVDCNGSSCNANQFQCTDGACIPYQWKCDLDKDCGDGSDEDNCTPAVCREGTFACLNGRCIPNSWVCDKEKDCPEGLDESNCSSILRTCSSEFFQCRNSRNCIPLRWLCDGEDDCQDASDEKNCSSNCSQGMFKCDNRKCIDSKFVCDGDDSCGDNSDEAHCTNNETVPTETFPTEAMPTRTTYARLCMESMFECKNKMCIPLHWTCDDVNDCGDNSDELGCSTTTSTTALPTCSEDQFRCLSGRCIDNSQVCNVNKDCEQGEDEAECQDQFACTQGQHFRCKNDSICIPVGQFCDGIIQCADASDEESCDVTSTSTTPATSTQCYKDFIQCDSDRFCLPLADYCDGVPDCFDGSDEQDCRNQTKKPYQVLRMYLEESSINSTSLHLFWWIPEPKDIKFEFLPSIAESNSNLWKNHTNWLDDDNFRFVELHPLTEYNMTVFTRVSGQDLVHLPALYITKRTSKEDIQANY